MLSFSEKRKLQKIVQEGLAGLDVGLSFAEKRRVQKDIADALAKLNAAIDTGIDNQKLADLIAGKFNGEAPERFLAILKEIVKEINDVEPVKEPTIKYIEANAEKVAA